MNIEVANCMAVYLKIAKELNDQVTEMLTQHKNTFDFENQELLINVVHNIAKIIPMQFIDKKLRIDLNSGIMCFGKQITYFENDLSLILDTHKEVLDKCRKIRNKTEHQPHKAFVVSYVSDSQNCFTYYFDIVDSTGEDFIFLSSAEILKIVNDINLLFSKIQSDIFDFAERNNLTGYQYYKDLSNPLFSKQF